MGRMNIQKHVDTHLGESLSGAPIRPESADMNAYDPFGYDVNAGMNQGTFDPPPETYKTFGDDTDPYGVY